jgi:hypothetical protein
MPLAYQANKLPKSTSIPLYFSQVLRAVLIRDIWPSHLLYFGMLVRVARHAPLHSPGRPGDGTRRPSSLLRATGAAGPASRGGKPGQAGVRLTPPEAEA